MFGKNNLSHSFNISFKIPTYSSKEKEPTELISLLVDLWLSLNAQKTNISQFQKGRN
jgi:hypothetical protein